MRERASIGFVSVFAGVLMALGVASTLGFWGDSRWLGVFLLFSGAASAASASLAVQARRGLREQLERDRGMEPPRTKSEARPAGFRYYPLLCGATLFVVGALAEDIVVGVMGGLAGLAFGWLATRPIETRRRR
jgi:hypothetical protein